MDLLTALLLAACGDNGGATSDASTGATSNIGVTDGPATSTPTTTPDPTTPTGNPTTEVTDSGMSGTATMGTTGEPGSTGNPTTATTTTNPTSATDTDPGTTGGTTGAVEPGTTTGTTTDGTTGGMESSGGDSTTGEDPNFGEIPVTCAQAELSKSTVGCLFYAIDMDSHDLAETGQYAVAVANVQKMSPANVTIERKQGGVWNVIAGPTQIGTLNLTSFNLPDQHTNDSQLAAGFAYRVKSDVPVIAYQFNPVDGQSSYLSDAAMLYPVTAWDHINHAITFTSTVDNTATNQYSYASAVAYADGTKITVTPKVATKSGPGVPAGQAGVPFDVMLNEGDVLSVAVNAIGTSLSGTTFESVKETPFGMFAGTECAQIPANVCCCESGHRVLRRRRRQGAR